MKKNNYYKIICILIFIALLMTLIISAVKLYKKNEDVNGKIQISTTVFPYYSIANEICQYDANVVMLLKPGVESHTYEPTTEDIIAIKNSNIFIYTGGESDKWVETILASVDTDKTKIIKIMDYIEPLKSEHNEKTSNDEHVWTSLKNARIISKVICDAVCEANPECANDYKLNTKKFADEINCLDKQFEETINSYGKTMVFADRFPFSYFAKDYNLKYISAFSSCSEESEPSIQTMAEIIKIINTENISSIFYIEFSNQKIADTIQNEINVKKLLFHSCHNVTAEEFNSGATYLSLMQQNLKNLKEATN